MTQIAVKALTFDLYGTLLDVEGSVLAAFAAFLRGRGSPLEAAPVVRQWESAYFQETLIDTILGHGRTPFETVSRVALSQTLARLGVDHTPADLETLLASRDQGAVYGDVVEGLAALRTRYPIVVLSNGDLASLERAVRNLRLPVDRVVSAAQANAYKPHPAVYHAAARQLGLPPGQLMHVASHNWDIRGARAAGLRGAYVNRHQIPYGDTRYPPDVTVADLFELAGAIP